MTKRYVLMSGASGGIGKATAEALAAQGFTLFAGALNDQEAADLRQLGHQEIVPVVLDLTSTASIDTAVRTVADTIGDGGHLSGLVNISGINLNAPLQYMSLEEIRLTVDINLVGSMLLTRAALPLLRRGNARVVFVGSATAIMPPPAVSVYAATKCGIEGLSDALRLELGLIGIPVSLIEPGVVRTPMTAAGPRILEMMLGRMSDDDRSRYEGLMRKIVQMSSPTSGVTPDKVADAIVQALTVPRPKSRYRVGIDCRIVTMLRHLPDGARDFIQRKTFGIR